MPRRIMRRTMRQGRASASPSSFLPTLYDRAIEVMGGAYPELEKERATIERWARAEEEPSAARWRRASGCSPT